MKGDARQARVAPQTPEQTPDGPVPFHLPLPIAGVNLPVPTAWRGPATPLILVAPEPAMRPAKAILCMTNLPLVAEICPPVTATPILMMPQWPLVVVSTIFQLPSNLAAIAGRAKQRIAREAAIATAHRRLPIMKALMLVVSCPSIRAVLFGGNLETFDLICCTRLSLTSTLRRGQWVSAGDGETEAGGVVPVAPSGAVAS